MAMDGEFDRHFNRIRGWATNYYIPERGGRSGETRHRARLKCKLLHGRGFSVIAPDQLYLYSSGWKWIQPLAFMANLFVNHGDNIECVIPVDISGRETVRVLFSSQEFLRRLEDGSELYDCTIVGPEDLHEYTTGTALFSTDLSPRLRLYHFTNEETKPIILESGHFRGSPWNIQGNKKLANVGYAYFTCLDALTTNEDLRQIAMASDGSIHLITDRVTPPEAMIPQWLADHADDALELKVYRENTTNRTARIDAWVEASTLAPQHIHRHSPLQGAVYYNITLPFIYRVGLPPGQVLALAGEWIHSEQAVKRFPYAVLGDATTLEGLAAPFDEENTKQKFLIQNTVGYHCLLNYWVAQSNRDLVSGREVEEQQFQA
jgi:hypothetical protein